MRPSRMVVIGLVTCLVAGAVSFLANQHPARADVCTSGGTCIPTDSTENQVQRAANICAGYPATSSDYQWCEQTYLSFSSKAKVAGVASTNSQSGADTDLAAAATADSGSTADIAAVKTAAVADLTAFDLAQVVPTDTSQRLTSATTDFAATKTRILQALQGSIAPDVLQATTDELADAYKSSITTSPTAPAFLDARFTAVSWQGVQVSGTTATATFEASEGLRFSDDPTVWLDDSLEQYVVQLSLVSGSWLMESHTAASVDPS